MKHQSLLFCALLSLLSLALTLRSSEAFATVTLTRSSGASSPLSLRPRSLISRQHLSKQQQQQRSNLLQVSLSSNDAASSEGGDSLASTSTSTTASLDNYSAATTTSPATAINGDSTTLVVLKEFEKKQAELSKRKQTALEQVQKFDSTLQQLERKKQEYLNGLQLQEPTLNFRETALRSVVKSFVWRVVAGLVTLITSLQFSGSLTTALSIVSSDFFSKAFTMFLGERLMDRSSAGRAKGADNVQRSLTKALVWRLFAICNTLTFAIFFSKDWSVAGKIAGTDAITKTSLMFLYERLWAKIQWGKEYLIEFSI